MTQTRPRGETQVIPSTVWSGPGCHGGCGVNLHVRDGELIKIEGAKESTLCIFLASYLVEKRELLATSTRRLGPLQVPDFKHFGPILLAWGLSMTIVGAIGCYLFL